MVTVVAAQIGAAAAVFAADYSDTIVAQLTAQGFGNIVVETTWLGRVRILAFRGDSTREIVVNPTTGEILRDLWLTSSGDPAQPGTIGGDGNSGPGGDDDDDDDDDGGNSGSGGGDDDDDNSGSGSGSGSGGGDDEDDGGDD